MGGVGKRFGTIAESSQQTTLPATRLSQLWAFTGLADGGLMPKTKTEVTRVVCLVFLFWLLISIALVLTTIVTQAWL